MAAIATINEPVLSREQLRTFHLTGLRADETVPAEALRPTILASLTELPELEAFYPMCVHPDGSARPFRQLVGELEHSAAITSAFRDAMNGQTCVQLEDAAPAAMASLVECSKPEIARLGKLLPAGAFLLAFHADSLVLLHAAALAEARRAQRVNFWDEVQTTAARLRELLLTDDASAPGAVSAQSVASSLGSRVGAFFNPASLAKALQSPRNPMRRMDAERRSRCETTLAMLDEGLHDAANQPSFRAFHSGIFGTTTAPLPVILFGGDARWAVDSFSAALQYCDSRLERFTHLLRALRVARLEMDSSFDPQVHEEMLARFDWQSASAAELNALPPVVVIETADALGQVSLTSFGRLLRSGLPVQILIVRPGIDSSDLSHYAPDFGFLSIAHRESFVMQSAMAQPPHLLASFKLMAKTLRPAVAVVAAPGQHDEEREAWLAESLLVLSRTVPLYTCDPESGARWSERFQLRIQPTRDLTAAHAAAVDTHLRRHFRLVTPQEWSGEQMELGAYLEAYKDRPPLAIPYIWVEGSGGIQQRALLTRDLVNFCVDRRRAWELFEELSAAGRPQPVPDPNARQEGARTALEQVLLLLSRDR